MKQATHNTDAIKTKSSLPRRRRLIWRWVGVVSFGVMLLLVSARLALPSYLHSYVNRTLDQSPEYDGRIGEIDVHLWRGAYTIHDMNVVKTTHSVPVPFFESPRTGRDMHTVHKGMKITNNEFDAMVGDIKASLDKLGLATREKRDLLAIIENHPKADRGKAVMFSGPCEDPWKLISRWRCSMPRPSKKSVKPPRSEKPRKEAAKQTAMLAESKRSEISRRKNILAGAANARIKGHASGATRAAQAKRDAQQSKSRMKSQGLL